MPNDDSGDNLALKDEDTENVIGAGVSWTGSLGGVDLRSSIVGTFDVGDDDAWGTNVGIIAALGGFAVAANVLYFNEDYDRKSERIAYSLGLSYEIGRYNFSITYGRGYTDLPTGPDEKNYVDDVVVGAEVGLLPGLAASLEVGWLDLDLGPSSRGACTGAAPPSDCNDDGSGGVVGVARLALSF